MMMDHYRQIITLQDCFMGCCNHNSRSFLKYLYLTLFCFIFTTNTKQHKSSVLLRGGVEPVEEVCRLQVEVALAETVFTKGSSVKPLLPPQ